MTYGNEVFEKQVGHDHPACGSTLNSILNGCATEILDTDEKCYALLELINQLEWRIEDLEKKL